MLDSLKGEGGTGLVILDDVSVLEWIGFSLVDVVRFVRALRAACLKVRADADAATTTTTTTTAADMI